MVRYRKKLRRKDCGHTKGETTLQRSMPILLARVFRSVDFPAPGGPSKRVILPGMMVPLMLSRMTYLCLLFLKSPVKLIKLCIEAHFSWLILPQQLVWLMSVWKL